MVQVSMAKYWQRRIFAAYSRKSFLGWNRSTLFISVLLLVFCIVLSIIIVSNPSWTSSSTDKANFQVTLAPNVFRPASLNTFESDISSGPAGQGWGEIGNSPTILGHFSSAAVSSDGAPCATVAKDVLFRNGSAADAAIAGLFCLGVVNSQSAGLGGGFLLTYYDRKNRIAYTLDAREKAPLSANFDMFQGDATKSQRGPLSIAVPGELRGYSALHRKFGVLPWSELLEPAIKLCEEGHKVNWHMARALKERAESILRKPTMNVFVNVATGQVYKQGDVLKRPDLARTLRAIQKDPDALYTGQLSNSFLNDLKSMGSIIEQQDLVRYKPKWRNPVRVSLSTGNFTLYSAPPPGSGLFLGFIFNVLDEFKFSSLALEANAWKKTYQRVVEAFKYGYAKRTLLGDEDFEDVETLKTELMSEKFAASVSSAITTEQTYQDTAHYGAVFAPVEDFGTSHLSLLASNGDAVSVTSTINLYFGSELMSTSTGIILNDEMDDFSSPDVINHFGLPPSPANFIKPGKRPVSSMCPTIITDGEGNVRLVLGAAGGSKIISSVSNVMLHHLWWGSDLKQAIDARRIHHQLLPMSLMYEVGFNETVLQYLKGLGHVLEEFSVGGSVVCAVAQHEGRVYANADFRKSGHVDGL